MRSSKLYLVRGFAPSVREIQLDGNIVDVGRRGPCVLVAKPHHQELLTTHSQTPHFLQAQGTASTGTLQLWNAQHRIETIT